MLMSAAMRLEGFVERVGDWDPAVVPGGYEKLRERAQKVTDVLEGHVIAEWVKHHDESLETLIEELTE